MRPERTRALAGLLILALLAAFAAARFRLTTSITHFLLSPDEVRLGRVSRQLTRSELARTMIFVVEAPGDLDRALAAADALAAALADEPEIAWARAGVEPGADEAIYALYHPRRFAFARSDPSELPALTSAAGIDAALVRLKRELRGPMAPLVKRVATGDPWLLFLDRMRALQRSQGGELELRDGAFVTRDGAAAVVLAATRHAPFDSAHQAPLDAAITARLAKLRAAYGDDLQVERSAIHRFALRSEAEIRADIQRISIVSTVGIVALFALLYRSLLLLLLAFIPLAGGVITATAVSLALFGELHGLTLAFGSTLIGVCIDYPVHTFTHLKVEPDAAGPSATIRRVWPGIAVGAATTVAGFAGLAAASFPGIREIGVFSLVGVAAAAGVTRAVLPGLLPARLAPSPPARRAAAALSRGLAWLQARRGALWLLPAAAVLVATVGLARAQWVDDASALNRLEPAMLAEDERVRSRVAREDAARMVLAFGSDLEQALARNDRVHGRLSPLVRRGDLGLRSLHTLLWSAALQNSNMDHFYPPTADPALPDRLRAGLRRGGFVPEAFAEVFSALGGPRPSPLTLDDLDDTPLGPAARTFVLDLDGEIAVATFLHDVADADTVASAVVDLPGVVFFDQRAFMADSYRRYRRRIQRLVLAGLVVVALVLLARYRDGRRAAAAFLPALLAAAATLALLGLSGQELTILHLVGALLVLSMGVDYGVFLAEDAGHGLDRGATLLGLCAACLSTVLAFGLLGLSSNPALAAVGATAGLGVLLSLALAPTTLVLLRREETGGA